MKKDNSAVNSFDNLPITLTVSDISKVMGLSLAKTYELTRRRDFPCIHVGRRLVVPKSSFIKWLDTTASKEV